MTTSETIEQSLRKKFASAWLNQAIQLKRLNFTPRQIYHAERCAWLVFMELWKKLNPTQPP